MQVKLSGNNYSIEAKGNEVIYNEQMDNAVYKKATILKQIPILISAVVLIALGFILNLSAVAIIILLVSIAYFSVMFYSLNKTKAYYLLTDTDIYVFNNLGVNNHTYEQLLGVEVNKDSKILTLRFDVIPKKLILYVGDKIDEVVEILSNKASSDIEFKVKEKQQLSGKLDNDTTK